MTVPIPETDNAYAEIIDALYRLAGDIYERFMPTAINCACQGEEISCQRALNDGRVWERKDAVDKIVAHIRAQAAEFEQAQTERAIADQQSRKHAWHQDPGLVNQP